MEEKKDEQLWKIAKKRAAFQRGVAAYFIVNAFLWILWWITSGRHGLHGIPWPLWVSLGWGIGIGFSYLNAYGGTKKDLAEKEYNKLKDRNHS